MIPIIGVGFCLTGYDVELEEISRALNLEPTNMRKAEEFPAPSIAAGFACDEWYIRFKNVECKALSVPFEELKKLLEPKISVINELCKKYSLETSVTVMVEMEAGINPEMYLSKENIQFLAKINADIGFDMYID